MYRALKLLYRPALLYGIPITLFVHRCQKYSNYELPASEKIQQNSPDLPQLNTNIPWILCRFTSKDVWGQP